MKVKYVGKEKIHAVKTIRDTFDIGLKEAKDAMEDGFILTNGNHRLYTRKGVVYQVWMDANTRFAALVNAYVAEDFNGKLEPWDWEVVGAEALQTF